MSTLDQIEAAADALPSEQKEELLRFLVARLLSTGPQPAEARLVRMATDALLEAPAGAPPMTPENIKKILQDWP